MRGAAEHGGVWWFHEWRKRSKDFRYQLDFLSPLWPGVLAAVADDLHRLTDLLGRANDLELLTHTLDWMPQPEHEELFQGPTVDRLHELQAETWKEALRAGARLYSEKPGRMVKRMEACWDVTQKR